MIERTEKCLAYVVLGLIEASLLSKRAMVDSTLARAHGGHHNGR